MRDVVVIGAGVTGLYSSLELLKRDFRVTLIEARPNVGGMARSIVDGEFIFDVGSHVIHTNNPKYKNFIIELLGEDLLEKNITAKSYFDGKYHNFPPIMKDVFAFPKSKVLKILFTLSFGRINQFRKKKGSFEEQLIFLGGRDLYNTYFKGYTAKFWGISPKDLSSKWVPKRVIPRFSGRSALANEWQAYPKQGGIETISLRMAELIKKRGETIHTQWRLKRIQKEDKKVCGIVAQTPKGEQEISCDNIISTIPLPQLFNILGKRFELKYRSMIFVFLKIKENEVLPNTTICFFPSSELPFTRLYEMPKYSQYTCPRGYTSLGVEVPCFYQDHLWNRDEDEISEIVIESLIKENIISKDKLAGHLIHKEQYAYPIPTIDYYERIRRLRKSIDVPNLYLAGRMGYFQYLDMCDAMESGEKAVSKLVSTHEI
jgi:protoporphyrinogen oxidase